MSIKAMSWAWEQDIPPTEKFILVTLCDHYNEDEGAAWMSQGTLARRTGYSKRTVIRALGEIEKRGLLVSVRRASQSGGDLTKLYRIQRGDERASPGGDAPSPRG